VGRYTGLLNSEKKAWLATAIYLAFLYSTLTVAFDLYVSIFDRIGRESMSWWMNTAIAAAGLAVIAATIIRIRPSASGYAALLLIGLTLAFCLAHLPIPAKRFHFFQYVPLTLLVFHALRFRIRDHTVYIWTMVLVTVAGLGDELIQWALPDRHFGVLDLVLNSTAGLLALVFLGFVRSSPHSGPPRQSTPRRVSAAPSCEPPTPGRGF